MVAEIEEYGAQKLKDALMDANKLEREENVAKVKAEIAEVFLEKYPDNAKDVAYITQKLVKKIVRRTISVDKIRPDGRQLDEVRPVSCEVGLLARPHGSSLFTRGQTQILNVLALAPLREAQILDGLGAEETKRYIHHYNFPPYSVGETKPLRSPAVVKSVTVLWLSVLCVRLFLLKRISRMQSVWYPRFWNPTVPPPWALFAQAPCP